MLIQRMALVSRTERVNMPVTVGEGPRSRTQIKPNSVRTRHSSVTPRKAKKRPMG